MLTVRKVSHITVGVMEHFYFFPTGVVVQTLSVQNCLKTISETMWSAGSPGPRRTNRASSAWKILFLFLAVLWSLHGPLLRSCTTLWKRKFLWRGERSVMEGSVSFGAILGDPWSIMTAISTQSVPLRSFTRHALIFPFGIKSQIYLRLLINASSSGASVQSASSSGPNQCGQQQSPALTTLTTAETMRSK